jgi:hypothetical protein
MAIPWLVVLKTVPWTQVIKNAPRVAEGAKKLWNAVSGTPPHPLPARDTHLPPAPVPESVASMQARLAALEIAADALHEQMLASSELIKSLADQHAELVQRIEAGRVRAVWLARATAVFGVVAAISLIVALGR